MRFAVHRPGVPAASPRSHRMPCGDVPGRVHVGVTGETAGHAAVQGLALAAARCNVPARRATLAREGGMNPLYSSRGLILQPAHQQPPARSQDTSVQPSLSPDVTARPLHSALCGSGHADDAEILDTDHVKSARESSSRLLGPAFRQVGCLCVPAKKFVIAWRWSRIACCCTITLPSASHGLAARAAVNCRHRSANPGAEPRPTRHQDSCSTHRFHTNRASAQCRSNTTSCV